MDIRWKKFRDGTEEKNPAWSFCGSVAGPAFALIAFALSRGAGFWMMVGLWFLVLSVVSWGHLGQLMRNEKENLIPVSLLDKTYPDLMLFLFLCVMACNAEAGWVSYREMVRSACSFFWNPVVLLFRFSSILFMTGTLMLFAVILYMSVMRHVHREKLKKKLFFYRANGIVRKKSGVYWKRWEEYRIVQARKGPAARMFRKRQLRGLYIRSLVLLLFCVYLWETYLYDDEVLFLLLFIGAVCFLADLRSLLRTSREVGVLLDEIEQIAGDCCAWEEPVLKPHSMFRRTEEMLLDIRRNKKESMEKQLQSERMKVDLITNVSHDLKTPLTSMIGCIDLLKKVEALPQEAQDYVTLLSLKAERLREMIQDVFEMAKATSGGQDLKMERLDMIRLIRQTMADMQESIQASGLHFRIKAEGRELPFMGDSKKMYRVYQNLIENTLKYSMPGSRVYVEICETDGRIRTSVKNTSNQEMDFDTEEIMERFTRGDKSRSTEGNGLGLAIAKSFTEACGGSFRITLDGDLFKAETEFYLAQAGRE